MTDQIPADAVREAHIKALTFLLRSSGSDTLTREEAAALQYAIDRLAALAGAGPVGWIEPVDMEVLAAGMDVPPTVIYAKPNREATEPLYRTYVRRKVTDADVERAAIAFCGTTSETMLTEAGSDAFDEAMRAALATFAEGAE